MPYPFASKKRFFPSFQSDWWVCIPDPLSPKSGLGMKVATMPKSRAMFLTMYLYIMQWSAILTSGLYRISISFCPAVATSWWCTSTGIPVSIILRIIWLRTSWSESCGGTGKYPSL